MILPVPHSRASVDPHSVRRLLADGSLLLHVQPIVDLLHERIVGHETLVRTPPGCAWSTPDRLFAAARREGCTRELELACLTMAIARWRQETGFGQLFVNVSAQAIIDATATDWFAALDTTRASLAGVVLELTEHERVEELTPLQAALARWRAAGAQLALDDFGDGRSSLRLWSELQPEYVKIDMYFVRHVHRDGQKLQTLRALQQLAATFGSRLIAEGVESAEEMMVLRDLRLPLSQGYLIGRPQPQVCTELPGTVRDVLSAREIIVLPAERPVRHQHTTARELLIEAPALDQQATHEDALALFQEHPSLEAAAIIRRDGTPLGLITRRSLLELTAQRYFRDLYGRRACLLHAVRDPLCVELATPVEQLTQLLLSPDQRYLRDGFIITENGRYRGLGTGEQLVRRVTEARIEAARHANPLTCLPGNVPISEHIERLLDNGEPFMACYADLNQFKAFNDHYGYWRGDEIIRLAARCLSDACDPLRDFIGHVGGDDFVLLMQSSDWESRLRAAVARFNAHAADLYDAQARQAGGIWAEDRHGVQRFHALTTLSIGAVRVHPARYRDAEAVASAAAAAKHVAKQGRHGLYLAEREAGHGASPSPAPMSPAVTPTASPVASGAPVSI
ncbi:MAG: phosphodiesterase [Tepidimonas taiwanensis]|nr:phosphodiesterase [Tepidimonas taiwanensis]